MTPKDSKFTMPPEWSTHQRTFIAWPVKESCCWPENYTETCQGWAEVAHAIAAYEPVTMVVQPGDKEAAAKLCGPGVDLLEIEHNDSWLRDNGPTFVTNTAGEIAGINWKFNAWGEKYSPWDLDDQVASRILNHYNIPVFDAPLIIEGGSIHVDGEGTLLTTEECLLNPNRNPHLNRDEITELLKKYLGIEKIIWLKNGLFGDETDGHIDNVACFARPGAVILQVCNDPDDPNYNITQANLQTLDSTIDAQGRKLEIIKIEQPPASYYKEGRLTLSYLNFYFVNGGIVLPVFGGQFSSYDDTAEAVLQKTYPDRKITRVDGLSLVREGGNVHCITQQMPSGIPAKL